MPTMFSLAIRPVIEATVACQLPKPRGAKIQADCVADSGQDALIQLILSQHGERTVHEAEVAQEPDQDGGQQ